MLMEMVVQQQRLAQAGLITGSLAHDVNNHLQCISGASFLALQSQDPAEWRRALERIQERCCAVTETTRSFLGFLRRREMHGAGAFCLARAAKETQRLVEPLAKKHDVRLDLRLSSDANVMGEYRLVVQALVNLVTNAIRALTGRPSSRVEIHASTAGEQARITVSDNGPGIPAGIRSRIFRPLTTSHGNGLGLFIVRQNIRRCGGVIRVKTGQHGTCFDVRLPLI